MNIDKQTQFNVVNLFNDDPYLQIYSNRTAYTAQFRSELISMHQNLLRNHVFVENNIHMKRYLKKYPDSIIIEIGAGSGRAFGELQKLVLKESLHYKAYYGIEIEYAIYKNLKKFLSIHNNAYAIHADASDLISLAEQLHITKITRDHHVLVVLMQNTLGTIKGKGDFMDILRQIHTLQQILPTKHTHALLSLYNKLPDSMTQRRVLAVLEILSSLCVTDVNIDDKFGVDCVRILRYLLQNHTLLPSYFVTQSYNGWEPDIGLLLDGYLLCFVYDIQITLVGS